MLCNTSFNQLLSMNFDIKSVPKNIFKILLSDKAAKVALQNAIWKVNQAQQLGSTLMGNPNVKALAMD